MDNESRNRLSAVPLDHSGKRRAPGKDDRELNAAARALLASIEETARPLELARAFPRIVNRMAALWKSKQEMDRYFEELLTDTRGNRKGFPLGVLMELTTLRDYYQTKVFASGSPDVWDAVERARRKA